MKTDDSRKGDEEASDPDSWLAAKVPEYDEAEDDETSIDSDDSGVGDASWVQRGRTGCAMLVHNWLS